MQQLAGLRASVSRRDFTGLEDSAMELKSLVYKRDYTSESGGDLTALQAQIAKLTGGHQQSSEQILPGYLRRLYRPFRHLFRAGGRVRGAPHPPPPWRP